LPKSKRILTGIKSLPAPQDEPVRKRPTFEVIFGSLEIEQKFVQPASSIWRILAHWPRAWLALAGAVTIAWAIALGWAAFSFIDWIFD
jgi:hypothetical protein